MSRYDLQPSEWARYDAGDQPEADTSGFLLATMLRNRDKQVPHRMNPDQQYQAPWPAYLYTREDDNR